MKIHSLLALSLFLALPAVAAPPPPDVLDELVLAAGQPAPSFALAQAPEPAPTAGQSFLAALGPSLMDLLTASAIAGIGLLAAFLRAKSAESKVAKVSLVVTEAARAAVLELDATIKPKLKAYLADGVLSDEEKAELKRLAMDLLKTKLPAGLLTTAGSVFGAFTDTYLAGKVEQAVAEKNSVQAAAAVPPKA